MRRLVCVAAAAAVAAFAFASAAGGGSGTASPSLPKLLALHVPVLVLHPGERFQPAAVDGYLSDSDVQRKAAAGWEKVDGPLPSGGSDLRLDQRLCRAAEGIAASPCYAKAEAAHGSGPVVYGAAFRAKGKIDLQYWLWYPYNDYRPSVPAREFWQVHEGDWEAVSVILDATGKPVAAGYSQHSKGKRRDWAKVPKQGVRPLVYVALGSHANYFTAGVQRFAPPVEDPLFISLIRQSGEQPVDHTGKGRVVKPRLVRVSASAPSWMRFAGRWGEDEYVRTAGGQPVAISPGGPRGPAFHSQWQRPVVDVLSWPRG